MKVSLDRRGQVHYSSFCKLNKFFGAGCNSRSAVKSASMCKNRCNSGTDSYSLDGRREADSMRSEKSDRVEDQTGSESIRILIIRENSETTHNKLIENTDFKAPSLMTRGFF